MMPIIPKKNKCGVCKKKLNIGYIECRCSGLFCGIHRYAHEHNCSFDYKKFNQDQIKINNPKIIKDKFEKI